VAENLKSSKDDRLPMKCARSIVIVTVFAILMSGWFACRRSAMVEARVNDVRNLVKVHAEHGHTNADISQLITLAEQKGIRVVNPIPRDRSRPCYRVVRIETSGSSTLSLEEASKLVVIEETSNVDDNKLIVRGYADGHVEIQRRK
jgi:hypothetical protein